MKKIQTICIIQQGSKVLLGMKKRGFGQGRWNGFGGKVNTKETIETAAKREVYEEIGVVAEKIEQVGILEFRLKRSSEFLDVEVHVFRTEVFTGEPRESEEMKPHWFDVSGIPFGKMWPSDRHWWPWVLAGKKFRGKFVYDEEDNLIESAISEAER